MTNAFTRKLNGKKLLSAQLIATRRASRIGHKIGKWVNVGNDYKQSNVECVACGMTMGVDITKFTDADKMGGEALFYNCRKAELTNKTASGIILLS